MSETQKWQDENTRYLSEAIAQVRHALEKYAQRHVNTGSSPIIPEVVPPTFWQRLIGKTSSSPPAVPALLTPPGQQPEKPAAASAPALDKTAEDAKASPAFRMLRHRLGMATIEEQVNV